jgi:3-deoxy-manno-octulosonate cytidylyltransferase (CMP-KDO synthetase)
LRHLGIYSYRGDFLKRLVNEPPCQLEQAECLEQLRALYIGGRIAVIMTDSAGVGVDTPEDVAQVEAVLRDRQK